MFCGFLKSEKTTFFDTRHFGLTPSMVIRGIQKKEQAPAHSFSYPSEP